MLNCRTIHETVLRDIIDIIHDVKDSDGLDIELMKGKKSIKSIADASKNLILVFPVITSKNISIESASMIAKATERKAVSMLQLLFAASQITDSKDGLEYLKNFHSNLKIDSDITVDSVIDALDTFVKENTTMSFNDKAKYQALSEDAKRNLNYFLPDSVSEYGLNEMKVVNDGFGGIAVTESKGDKRAMGSRYADIQRLNDKVRDASNDIYWDIVNGFDISKTIDPVNTTTNNRGSNNSSNRGYNNSSNRGSNNSNNRGSNNKKGTVSSNDVSVKVKAVNGHTGNYQRYEDANATARFAKDVSSTMKNYADMFSSQLLNSDVKKANELVPTTMVVNFITVDGDNHIPTQMLIGVKAKLYPVDSIDIINKVGLKYKDNNNLIKFIRSTTREISFFKDFLFAIDKAKVEALSISKKGSSSPMWKVLERRARKSKIRRALNQANDASAITTLVMSQDEIDYLKKNEGIDLENPKNARSIMESYNFMCICIVDEYSEVAKFIYDTGDDVYENLSFSHLEKESNDSSTKKMLNVFSKLAR